jgi:hypothetical protein
MQVPFTAKQPEVRLIPFAKVELAVVDTTESVPVWIPPAKVEVEMFVMLKFVAVVVPSCERPETERAVEVELVDTSELKIELVA